MTAAVADHKKDLYDSRGAHRDRCVQVEHLAAGAIRIDRIGALFLPLRRELGWDAVAPVVTLREVALAVVNPDARHHHRRATRRYIARSSRRIFFMLPP